MPFPVHRGVGLVVLVAIANAVSAAEDAGRPASRPAAEPTGVVKIVKTYQGYRLLRNGAPYFIKGAGYQSGLEKLPPAGGNSIRTWDADSAEKLLDEAHALGLTVTVGIWLGHERHGVRYDDAQQVEGEMARARQAVERLKSHPAILLWGIGNEMEGDGGNPRVWQTVNRIAKMIKEIDPNHPTMTVIAGVWPDKIARFKEHCPDVDILGINAYGDLTPLVQELDRRQLDRPYVLTEFGPTGWWDASKTSWGAEREPTSTEKGETYLRAYQTAVAGQPGRCLGSYAFIWGHKQEHTRTWFGMFLPEGEATAPVDAMTFAWTGKWPANRCPRVDGLTLSSSEAGRQIDAREPVLRPGETFVCRVSAADPDGDRLVYRWELRSESSDRKTGGDRELAPPAHPDALISADGPTGNFRAPTEPGAYRIFVYVVDPGGRAATANVPVLVKQE